jgi:hypothetical protein
MQLRNGGRAPFGLVLLPSSFAHSYCIVLALESGVLSVALPLKGGTTIETRAGPYGQIRVIG